MMEKQKSRTVYLFDMGLELWELSRIMSKLMPCTTIWQELPLTDMGNTGEREAVGREERDSS